MEEKLLNLRLFCKNVKLDSRTQDYIVKRIQKIEKFLKRSLKYELEISMDKKGKFYAELMVRTPRKLYRTTEISESIEGAVDIVVEEIQRQIERDTDRVRDLRKRGQRSIKKKTVLDEKARF